ncbi:hypothetical protein O181_083173 [Austropuccinia psidii MF-1]|uniref:RRM domain-containing protein n=1 Tax=Austropuccinia psidii MF-1 TaxID=1389203 RepID=A0A9Q3IJA7_9BASI|nr:hypothetical protein [Austropuccinia psidii MF-1]
MSLASQRPRSSVLPMRPSTGRMASDRYGFTHRQKPYEKSYEKPFNPFSSYHHHHHHENHQINPRRDPPPPNPDGKWQHDLFEADSSLYGPKINFNIRAHLGLASQPSTPSISLKPSPSLRPFGSLMPSTTIPPSSQAPTAPNVVSPPQPVIPSNTQTAATSPQVIAPKPASGLSLLSRIQPGLPSKPLFPSPASTVNNPSLSVKPDFSLPTKSREAQDPKNRNTRSQQAFDVAMEDYLKGPVILEVANLADGTSAEDVKTAFADFGAIQECTTEEGPRHGNQPTLKAKMIFTHKAEAEKAVEALNGALADGLTLAVKIIGRPTKKPERADFMEPALQSHLSETRHLPPTTVKTFSQDVTMEDTVESLESITPTGRLRSEVVAKCDPRASIQSEPHPIPYYHTTKPTSLGVLRTQHPINQFSHNHHSNKLFMKSSVLPCGTLRFQAHTGSKSLLDRIQHGR